MKTYRVDPKEYEGKEPIAEGYKIFNWDWTGTGPYCYADGGAIAGSVHTVDEDTILTNTVRVNTVKEKKKTDEQVSAAESCGATGLQCCKCNPGGCNCREERHD